MEIVTLEFARNNGLKKYYTGEPCSRGEICQRRTSDKRCVGPECAKWQSIKNEMKRARQKGKSLSVKEAKEVRKKKLDEKGSRVFDIDTGKEKKKYKRCPAKEKAYSKAYHEKNREKIAEMRARYHVANREKSIARTKAYAKEHPESVAAAGQKLRAKRMKRVPCWYGDLDDFVAKEAALLCRDRKASTGIDWHVDHMIPMNARKVSGLHVWNNLQVIPAFLNSYKLNKLIMTEPMEWIGYIGDVLK